jgi:hypothetical protein
MHCRMHSTACVALAASMHIHAYSATSSNSCADKSTLHLSRTHPHGIGSSIVPDASVAVEGAGRLAEEGPAAGCDAGHASSRPAAPAGLGGGCCTHAGCGTN